MVPKLNLKKFCKNFMEINLKKIEKLPTDVQREFLETFALRAINRGTTPLWKFELF
jgi:hypothetical protein